MTLTFNPWLLFHPQLQPQRGLNYSALLRYNPLWGWLALVISYRRLKPTAIIVLPCRVIISASSFVLQFLILRSIESF